MAFETEVMWETCELWNRYGALNWNAGKSASPKTATALETEIQWETDGHLKTGTALESEMPWETDGHLKTATAPDTEILWDISEPSNIYGRWNFNAMGSGWAPHS